MGQCVGSGTGCLCWETQLCDSQGVQSPVGDFAFLSLRAPPLRNGAQRTLTSEGYCEMK